MCLVGNCIHCTPGFDIIGTIKESGISIVHQISSTLDTSDGIISVGLFRAVEVRAGRRRALISNSTKIKVIFSANGIVVRIGKGSGVGKRVARNVIGKRIRITDLGSMIRRICCRHERSCGVELVARRGELRRVVDVVALDAREIRSANDERAAVVCIVMLDRSV